MTVGFGVLSLPITRETHGGTLILTAIRLICLMISSMLFLETAGTGFLTVKEMPFLQCGSKHKETGT